jgi:hypothetical protein
LPVPPGYRVVDRPASGLLAGGLIGTGAAYATGLIIGATQGFKNASGWLALPLAGPWLAIATRNFRVSCQASTVQNARKCINHAVGEVEFTTFVAVDGVFQLAGGFVTLAGLLSTRQELWRSDLHFSFVPPAPGKRDCALTVQGNF